MTVPSDRPETCERTGCHRDATHAVTEETDDGLRERWYCRPDRDRALRADGARPGPKRLHLATDGGESGPSRDPRDARIEKLEERNEGLQGALQDVRDLLEPYDLRPDSFPEIVCLCGSTRFEEAFKQEQFWLTIHGKIVLTVAGNWKDDHDDVWDEIGDEEKERLDELHFRKIELADRVHVLNVDGYVGSSTGGEIRHAIDTGTEITWLEPENVPEEFEGPDRLAADGGADRTIAAICQDCDWRSDFAGRSDAEAAADRHADGSHHAVRIVNVVTDGGHPAAACTHRWDRDDARTEQCLRCGAYRPIGGDRR